MMYLPRHFAPHELLPGLTRDTTWKDLDPAVRARLDDRLLETCDEVRDLLGVPCTINNYATGGSRSLCGWRPRDCEVGAKWSQHKEGRAADLHPAGIPAEVARSIIRHAVTALKLPHLGGVELDVSWLHIDVRPRVGGKVKWFRP